MSVRARTRTSATWLRATRWAQVRGWTWCRCRRSEEHTSELQSPVHLPIFPTRRSSDLQPVHLVFVGAPADEDIAWHLRALIELGAGASLHVIEHHVGASPNAHLGNLVARYTLGAGARLDLVQVQEIGRAHV